MLHQPLEEGEDDRMPIIRWADSDRVFCMRSMPGNRVITAGAPSGEIVMWDARTASKEYTLEGHTDSVLDIIVLPNLNIMYSAGADSTVRLWNLETLQNTMVFEGHKGFIVGLWAIESDAKTGLFSGSDDRSIKQWNTNSGACVHTFKGHKGPVNCITSDDKFLYSGSSDGLLKVWDLVSRRCIRTVDAHKDSIWALSLLPNGRLISAGTDALIKVWEDLTVSANVISEFTAHKGKVRRLLVQGPILFSAGADARVYVWNLNSSTLVTTLNNDLSVHEKQISGMTLENNQLCTSGFDRLICRWDVSDLLPVKQQNCPYQPLSILRAKEQEEARKKLIEVNRLRSKRRLVGKTPEEIVATYKELPVNFVCEALDFKVERSRLTMEVLFYIPFLIAFVFVFMLNRPIEDNYYMVQSINSQLSVNPLPTFKMKRTFAEVDSSAWFRIWLSMVVRELWSNRDPPDPLTGYMRPSIHGQNILMGSLRIRSQRVRGDSCTVNPTFIGSAKQFATLSSTWDGGQPPPLNRTSVPCYGSLSDDTIDKKSILCPPTIARCIANSTLLAVLGLPAAGVPFLRSSPSVIGQIASYQSGGHAVDIPFNMTLGAANDRLNAMLSLGFVEDVATRMVDVSFFSYNPALNLFVSVRYLYEQPVGGGWFSSTRNEGFELFTWDNTGAVAFELFFFVFVLVFVYFFLSEAVNEKRKGRLLGFFLNWWNIMEFANLSIFVVMYSYRWHWMTLSLEIKMPQLIEVFDYPVQLEESQANYQRQVWFNAVNTVLTFLKLLKYVRLNDRLNVLTRTLAAASQSLFGVLVLFIWVTFAFALTANVLFGGGLMQWRSLDAAYVSLLRMTLGDFDYDAMSTENREVTLVFFWTFNVLCYFILLNFLVAVISDGFADVSQSKSPIPLDEAILKVFKDAKYECLPKTFQLRLLLLRKRRTQTGVVRETLEVLLMKRRQLVDQEAADRNDFDELDSMMVDRDDFMALIPNSVRTVVTEEFVEEVWKDMAWEYHYAQMAQRGEEQRDREALVHEEVAQALRDLSRTFPIIDSITQRLEQQEAKLRPFANTLGVSF